MERGIIKKINSYGILRSGRFAEVVSRAVLTVKPLIVSVCEKHFFINNFTIFPDCLVLLSNVYLYHRFSSLIQHISFPFKKSLII